MTQARTRTKDLGAFYTDEKIAEFLVGWAIRSPNDLVIDPSFGGGVFLQSALRRLPRTQVYGVEYDIEAYRKTVDNLSEVAVSENLIHADFFDVIGAPGSHLPGEPSLPRLDAVVGNPPYIRYHRFKGEVRRKAQRRAKEQGVELNGLSSSWAPFIVHAISFLVPGGRLAMVVPTELTVATYAVPVLKFLAKSFGHIRILAFRKKLFPQLSENTILLLADAKGQALRSMWIVDLEDSKSLSSVMPSGTNVDVTSLVKGERRMTEYFLPQQVRDLYAELKKHKCVKSLGQLATVGIGYVTGANDFFHLDSKTVARFSIPEKYLTKSVTKGAHLKGLVHTAEDWISTHNEGKANLLLDLSEVIESPPEAIRSYLELGLQKGVNNAYKCRIRKRWWAIPHIYPCDGFLTSMSGRKAKLVVNQANVRAANTLHIVRLKEGNKFLMHKLAVSWLTSLTLLSTEIEGHSLGGGLLKLEPDEARRTRVAMPRIPERRIRRLAKKCDNLIRQGRWEEANQVADREILVDALGLCEEDVHHLRAGAKCLRSRRYYS